MRIPFYLVAAALLAASKAEDNVSIKRLGASTESEPQHQEVNTVSIEAFSTNAHDDSNEDPPVDERRSSHRSRLERGSSRRSRISNEDPPVEVESRSLGDLTESWVFDWNKMKCVKGKRWTWGARFETPELCCQARPPWSDLPACVTDSKGDFTDKFYIDMSSDIYKCAQNCDIASGLPCMGSPPEWYMQRFDTVEDCCNKRDWLDADRCIVNTFHASGEWYVDLTLNERNGQCVMDCAVGGQSCGGLKEQSTVGYATSRECCAYLSSVEPGDCSL